jgi:hypothetical protein
MYPILAEPMAKIFDRLGSLMEHVEDRALHVGSSESSQLAKEMHVIVRMDLRAIVSGALAMSWC